MVEYTVTLFGILSYLEQPKLQLISSTLKNYIVTTTHHENKILERK